MHPSPAPLDVDRPVVRSGRLALLLICLAQLMLVVDITAVNIALPTLSADLGLTGGAVTWVVTAYVLAFGGLMLLGGRLADVVGRKRMLVVGLLVFTVGSLACGFAGSAGVLIGARVLQGVGAALLSPAALASVTTLFSGAERVRALGVWAGVGAAGFVGGLIVSGLLTGGPGWRWIFLINLPIGAVLLVALPVLLPPDGPRGDRRVDVPGALLATLTMGLLVYGLTRAGEAGWGDWQVLGPLGAAGGSALLFVLVEGRHRAPLIAPHVLRQRPVVTGLGVMLVASAAMLSIFFLASTYAQFVRGMSPVEAGLLFLPSAVLTMVSAHLAAHVITRHGTRAAAVGGFAVTAAGLGLLSRITEDSSIWGFVVPALALTSLGLGPAVVVATASTLARVRDEDSGIASGIVNTGHEVGSAFGLALLAATLGGALTDRYADAFADGFLGLAVGSAVMAGLCAVLVPPVRPAAEHLRHGH
jgi:EmrB/QacA subfamily drug resistance transporter